MLDALRRDGAYSRVMLCYIEGNPAARRLYVREAQRQLRLVETALKRKENPLMTY